MSALLVLTFVNKTVTTLKTVKGKGMTAAVILVTHWTPMDTPAMVIPYSCTLAPRSIHTLQCEKDCRIITALNDNLNHACMTLQ